MRLATSVLPSGGWTLIQSLRGMPILLWLCMRRYLCEIWPLLPDLRRKSSRLMLGSGGSRCARACCACAGCACAGSCSARRNAAARAHVMWLPHPSPLQLCFCIVILTLVFEDSITSTALSSNSSMTTLIMSSWNRTNTTNMSFKCQAGLTPLSSSLSTPPCTSASHGSKGVGKTAA